MDTQTMKTTLPQTGTISWIGIRPKKKDALLSVEEVNVTCEGGLSGDHYQGNSKKRQVTLIQGEHIEAVAKLLQKKEIDPGLLRRNIVIFGVNLQAFKDQHLKIGEEVILEMTGQCHPCSRMEQNLGAGGYNAMRGHGGITARVVQGGVIVVGDKVRGVLNDQ